MIAPTLVANSLWLLETGTDLTRSTRWLSDAEFADLGAFIARCREA